MGISLVINNKESNPISVEANKLSVALGFQTDPEDPDAWYYRGIASYNLGKYNDTIYSLKMAVQINPEDEDASGIN